MATDRFGFDRVINNRLCPLVLGPDERMVVDAKKVEKAQREYDKARRKKRLPVPDERLGVAA